MVAKAFVCRDCGSLEGFRSRPRTFSEKYILPALMLKPARCGDCFRRSYEWSFVQVRERPEPVQAHRIAA